MSKKVAVLPGDGIGPEVISSAVAAINVLTDDIELINGDIGYECYRRTGNSFPRATMDIIDECDAALIGSITVPKDTPFRNPLFDVKRRLGAYADVRVITKIIPDLGILPDVNAVFIRESDEGSFNAIEINELDGATLTKRVSYSNSKRICQYVRRFVERYGRRNITCVHNTPLYPLTDGLFLDSFRETMDGSDIQYGDACAGDMISYIVTDPRNIDTVLSINPYSDILSESIAALVGGSRLVPQGLMGDQKGIFKPLRDSCPDIEGMNLVNPTAMLLSTAMMLRFLGYIEESRTLNGSIRSAYKRGYRTHDVGGNTGTFDFTTQVVKICENGQ